MSDGLAMHRIGAGMMSEWGSASRAGFYSSNHAESHLTLMRTDSKNRVIACVHAARTPATSHPIRSHGPQPAAAPHLENCLA